MVQVAAVLAGIEQAPFFLLLEILKQSLLVAAVLADLVAATET